MTRPSTRSASINLRARPGQRALIDRAAATLGKNRSDFMLEAACREAENVLLDRRLFDLDSDAFDAFEAALAAPTDDNPALRRLLEGAPPWDD